MLHLSLEFRLLKPWPVALGQPSPGLSVIVMLRGCQELDKKLMRWNDCMFDTDDWDVLTMIRPNERSSIGKKQAVAIEPDNSNTRHLQAG